MTFALVPTGIKIGVSMSPCGVCSTPARACVVGSSAIRSNLKRLWSINWNSLVAVHTQTIIRATRKEHRLDRNWCIKRPVVGDVLKRLVVGDNLQRHLAKECPNLPTLRDCPQVPARVSLIASHLRTSPTTTRSSPTAKQRRCSGDVRHYDPIQGHGNDRSPRS